MVLSRFNETVAVSQYEEGALRYNAEEKAEEFRKAEEYNKSISGQDVQDPFLPGSGAVLPDNYAEILDVGMGVMGTLEIPCIDVKLPIYHGVSEEALRKGVGHIRETAFPIGGEGTHAVLSTHRGLPDAKLFSDLDEVEPGDTFYIRILGDNLAYEVDQVEVVDPGDVSLLAPEEGEDYVTLLTCTPYGINSHRLLVRGSRVHYVPEVKAQIRKKVVRTEKYVVWGTGIIAVFAAAAGAAGCVRTRRRKRRQI